jgi:hypothetical protein
VPEVLVKEKSEVLLSDPQQKSGKRTAERLFKKPLGTPTTTSAPMLRRFVEVINDKSMLLWMNQQTKLKSV